MESETFEITARDGYALAATLFRSQAERAAAIVIAPATGVKRTYYAAFAKFMAGNGFDVLTFDYRGIGDSAPDKLKGFGVRMHEWGSLDLAGVIDWVLVKHRPSRVCLVGHSAGGQLLGVTPNADQLDGIFLVACQSGHWRHWPGLHRFKLWLAWHALIPGISRLLGYFPGKLLGGSQDLPAGVALEWARWGRHRDYILSHDPEVARAFTGIRAPLASFSFTDDALAPKAAVDVLASWYTKSREKLRRHLSPSDLDTSSVGHFGFFRKRFSESLWREALLWFQLCCEKKNPSVN